MNPAIAQDTLTVINGPEDGTEFPLTQNSFTLGSDSSCAASIRLDGSVRDIHARAAVVSEGYRFRSVEGARIFVGGKPAGVVFSRVARNGDVVRIGQTDLVLTCGAEGLAGRSHGFRRQSDLFWAVTQSARIVGAPAARAFRIGRALGAFLARRLALSAIIIGVVLYFTMPSFRAHTAGVFDMIRDLAARISLP